MVSVTRGLAAVALLAVSACAGVREETATPAPAAIESPATSVAAPGKIRSDALASDTGAQVKRKVICVWEPPLGSHIPEKTCRYEDDINLNRLELQDAVKERPPVQIVPSR